MSIQFASNELHRAFIVTDSGRLIAGAGVALDAQKMATESRSKHAKAIATRAHDHVVSVLWRLEQASCADEQICMAQELVDESSALIREFEK